MEEKTKFSDKLKNSGAWIVLVSAAFLIIFGFVYAVQSERQREELAKTSDNTTNLLAEVKTIGEQNKELARQNKELSEKAARYAYCNAVILAQYTQTGQPITIEDLDKCVLTSFPEGISSEGNGSGESSGSLQNPTSNALAQNTPSGGNSNNPSTPSVPNSPANPNSPTTPNNPNPQTNGLVLNPSLQLSPTFLTPGVNLTAPLRVPCIGVPRTLSVC